MTLPPFKRRVRGGLAGTVSLLVAGAHLLAQPAAAQEPVRAFDTACEFELVYEAPAVCPTQGEVKRQIYQKSRAELIQSPSASQPAEPKPSRALCTGVVVQIAVAANGEHGRIQISDAQGHEVARQVSGASCREVVDVLALIGGMSLSGQIPPEDLPGTQSEPAAPSSDPAVRPAPAAPAQTPSATVASDASAQPRLATRSAEAPRHTAPRPWRLLLGVRLFGMTAAAPGVVPGLAGVLGLYQHKPNELAPRFRLALGRTQSKVVETDVGDGVFRLTVAQIEGCPVRWPRTSAWAIRPCAHLEAGYLDAKAQQVAPATPTPTRVFWRAGALTLAGELAVMRHLGIEAQGGLLVPLLRDRFLLPPYREVHEIPAVGWSAALTLSAFPEGV